MEQAFRPEPQYSGLGDAAQRSISSANNPLQATRLFVVSKPFSAILLMWGVGPTSMAQVQEEIPVENVGTGIASTQKYDAAQIDKLEGLEAVRKRPGMFIGDPDERGLHHLVYEVLDNSIDEHLAGFCTKIEVVIHVDGSISVRDNGRGIPVDVHPKWKMPAIELVLTNLHAGGKFGQGAYKYSGGLHGVGAKCTNALSEWFKAEVSRDGKVYHMAFAKGKTTDKLTVIGEVKNKKTTGTLITFLPDPTIFTITTEFKFERLAARLRELAFLNPGLEITLTDERRRSAKKGAILLQIRNRRVR